jgi:hypothetical protein
VKCHGARSVGVGKCSGIGDYFRTLGQGTGPGRREKKEEGRTEWEQWERGQQGAGRLRRREGRTQEGREERRMEGCQWRRQQARQLGAWMGFPEEICAGEKKGKTKDEGRKRQRRWKGEGGGQRGERR